MDYRGKVHDYLCGSDYFLQPLHDERLPHWKLNKANWEVFETLIEIRLFNDSNTIEQTLISIAKEYIAKISTSNNNKTPWFNDDCRKAIHLRKAALRKFYKQQTTTNLNDFKLLRANTQKLIKEAKKKSWQNYVKDWSPQPKPTQSGGRLGKSPENPKQQPSNNSQNNPNKQKQLQEKTIAGVVDDIFSENSSLKNSDPQFISYKSISEKQRLNFKINNSEKYNLPFTSPELKKAIQDHIIHRSAQVKFIMTFLNI